ncbi:hypothetical protein VTJ49DRAFT_3554 [Mycothermus thermophilus]|uniref:PH domain-containing protein n=1 Tax=Humicola insolens TaxID=85995 RepID=A0ABR3V793_HUMIN
MSYLLDPDSPESSPDHSNNSHSSHPRRTRPPDPYAEVDDALRVPLRPEPDTKARKRESKLGLRNLFNRARGGPDVAAGPLSPLNAASQKLGAIRASLAEISWPYGSHGSQGNRSEISLAAISKALPVPSLKHKKSESIVRQQPETPEGIAAWTPPPLFRAYPQAIKHAHLPACTLPAETLLRLHHQKTSGALAALLSPTIPDFPEDPSGAPDRPRRHRRTGSGSASRLEWTSKVYVLATSGYLLQYAGEGTYDRLPERVLQLGKDSAAFASDAIPGRHWVLQVSAVAESDTLHAGAHSSLLARLPFRGPERKHCSTFLMVFENVEDMESWMSTLRGEIEKLGGRKVLSETGKPKTGPSDSRPGRQTSQRALVRPDPNRFSRVMYSDDSWKRQSTASSNPSLYISNHDQSFDDNSTASFISHEGRQLDGLRDSTNRLSYHSLGQRTMVTSVGSSPACSPIRDSFGDFDSRLELSDNEDQQPQPKMRPNARAIIDRRRSLQAINHVLEMRVAAAQGLRPASNVSDSSQTEAGIPFGPPLQPTTPNISIPHGAVNKRHSFGRASMGMPPTQTTPMSPGARMSARRPPPSALSINPRPLSLVEDQPSPAMSSASGTANPLDKTENPPSATQVTPPVSLPPPQRPESRVDRPEFRDEPIRDSGISTQDQPSSGPAESDAKALQTGESTSVSADAPGVLPLGMAQEIPVEVRPTSPPPGKMATTARRPSLTLSQIDKAGLLSPPPISPGLPQQPRSHGLRHVPGTQHLRRGSEQSQTQTQAPDWCVTAHSAADGPPPAPPPNRALPPIPKKSKANVPPPGFI